VGSAGIEPATNRLVVFGFIQPTSFFCLIVSPNGQEFKLDWQGKIRSMYPADLSTDIPPNERLMALRDEISDGK
jgi:hypothetical protein